MKVLHIINNLGSGGAEKLLEDLIPLMNKMENVEADILLLTDEKNVFYDSLINKGVKVDVVKYRNMYDVRNIFEIKKYIVYGGYDIVHSHVFPTQYWVALSKIILRNKKVKFITTEHSTHNRRREKFYFMYIDKFIYAQYDSIISITEKTRDNLIDWIDPKRKNLDKHIVIENGVDIEKIKVALPYKKSELIEGINENTKLICMVGRFSEAKDQPTLIRAVSKLSRDIHLILVGEGPLMADNKKLAEELGVSDRVHFLGFRQDIPRILKTVDIVVLGSHWEGFGLAAVEGMAAGKPVVVSDVEGLRDVVKDKESRFILRSDEDLSGKITNILFFDEIYYRKVNYSNKRCLDFRLDEKVKQLVNLYFELI
ncbi:glycosyltransferase [Alkalibacterium sp. MB6]|uniref:glycosyltransferase n=1 Tax=Alkalibacterium sp. MB6 TaxID=2081965 RepID=UPI00137B05C7|nr:glycosyltransferase [Alkalibacterium sp. MB6]